MCPPLLQIATNCAGTKNLRFFSAIPSQESPLAQRGPSQRCLPLKTVSFFKLPQFVQ